MSDSRSSDSTPKSIEEIDTAEAQKRKRIIVVPFCSEETVVIFRPNKRFRRKTYVNLKDPKGETALSKAMGSKNLETVLKLLKNGADPDVKIGVFPILLFPFTCGMPHPWNMTEKTTFVQACLEAGADPDVRATCRGEEGKTLLMIACERNYRRIVDELLKAGADQNLQDKAGKSPLMYATERGKEKIIQSLLSKEEK